MKLQGEDLGFNRNNVLLLGIDPRLAGYKTTELATLYQQVVERLSSLPQVQSVSIATYSPLSGTRRSSSVQVNGYTPQPGENLDTQDILVAPKYAETLGMPLLRGRDINERDTPTSTQIAVINSAFAEHFFKDQNPIGRTFSFDDDTDKGAAVQIVGVVGDIKRDDVRDKPDPTVYRPIFQVQDQGAYTATIHIRTQADTTAIAGQARQLLNQIDDKLPVFGVTTLSDQMHENLGQERL